jgi:hypothetical protein
MRPLEKNKKKKKTKLVFNNIDILTLRVGFYIKLIIKEELRRN